MAVVGWRWKGGNRGQVRYPTDVLDQEWAFVAPYVVLCYIDSFNGFSIARTPDHGIKVGIQIGDYEGSRTGGDIALAKPMRCD